MKTLQVMALVCCLSSVALAAEQGSQQDLNAINAKMSEFTRAWNNHDPQAMANVWATDATLINPFGHMAKGHDEITRFFEDEQSGRMKNSHVTASPVQIRWVAPNVAFIDSTMTISNVVSKDGKPLPTMKPHLSALMVKNGDQWQVEDARAFNFTPEQPPRTMGRTVQP